MKKVFSLFLLLTLFCFAGCEFRINPPTEDPSEPNLPDNPNGPVNPGEPIIPEVPVDPDVPINPDGSGDIEDNNDIEDIPVDDTVHQYNLKSSNNTTYTYYCSQCKEEVSVTINLLSGQKNYSVSGNTITFNSHNMDTIYSISGKFYGNIVVNNPGSGKIEIELNEFEINSFDECPINISSQTKVTISGKKDTKNTIIDQRGTIDTSVDSTLINDAIYADCDLDIQGRGYIEVKSVNNNGVHSKDDINIKNVVLYVDSIGNCIKGNDSVTVESGDLTLISRSGDGIKTSNTHVSNKLNQKGNITINGGNITIYSSCDGLDASYNVIIEETTVDSETNSLIGINLTVFTDKYSSYSEEVIDTQESKYYIKSSSNKYYYSVKYYMEDGSVKYVNTSNYTSNGYNSYYYEISKPSGCSDLEVFVYNSSAEQGQDQTYYLKSELLNVNNSYDTISLSIRQNRLTVNWTNYQTSMQPGGRPGGMGGFDGNTDKGTYSTKAIIADNEIIINSGILKLKSYDDAIHASNTATLENGESPLGNITINGGTLYLYTNDDGIHADNCVTINGGYISVLNSYEGVEGGKIIFNNGYVVVNSIDDGVNGTNTSGDTILFNGGIVYINCTGDGIDSNSKTSGAVKFNGSNVVVISNSRNNSAIDTEMGYSYSSGIVVAIGVSGGMTNETTNSNPSFNSIGTQKSMNLTQDTIISVSGLFEIKMPISMNSVVVVLNSSNLNITSSQTSQNQLDANGVWFK